MSERSDLPKNVQQNICFFEKSKIWYVFSNNEKSIGCADAANKRKRLGQTGIPIFDELKSELGYFINEQGRKQKVLVHCRGNQKLDRYKISSVLGAEYQRDPKVPQIKGTVNPFDSKFRGLLQIFDTTTTKNYHPPYTMMTNAGDYCHAFEFKVNDLIRTLINSKVADVVRIDNTSAYTRHKIGILTGNGPDSGMLLWKLINDSINSIYQDRKKSFFAGDLSYPEIIVSSVPDMGISMELKDRLHGTLRIVRKAVTELCQNGITILCVACNTTQYFQKEIREICELNNVVFVSIPEVVEDYLKKNHADTFYLLGISHVIDFKSTSAFAGLDKEYSIFVPDSSTRKIIEELAYKAKIDVNKAANPLVALMKRIDAALVVVALTEISTILDRHKKTFKNYNIVDSLQLLAEHIAEMYVDGIFDTLFIDKSTLYASVDEPKNISKTELKNALTALLQEIDHEFIPPLSCREGTTTTDFSVKANARTDLNAYLTDLLDQKFIICKRKDDGHIIGFMSYKPDHLLDFKKDKKCYYITTVGVTKSERGKGIAVQFYRKIEEIASSNGISLLATRTWSINDTHIEILSNHGYKLAKRIKSDRGPGIDSVYYMKDLQSDAVCD